MIVIGIDPGLTGAIAFIDTVTDKLISVIDMPVAGGQIVATILHHTLHVRPVAKAYIEKVGARPGQGVSSMFKFGRGLGVVEGVLGSMEIPIEWLSPQAWKKPLGLIGKDKDAARLLAIECYPEMAEHFRRKKDGGRADAALIAKAGVKKNP